MKKFFSWMLVAALIASFPSMASARRLRRVKIAGEVTKVETKTITLKQGTRIETIFVPEGTPISGGSLSELIGKHVTIHESAAGIAKSIEVAGGKGQKTQN